MESNFKETKNIIKQNQDVEKKYLVLVNEADQFYADNFIELTEDQQIDERKIDMCNFLRQKAGNKFNDLTDEQLVDEFIALNKKYEDEKYW